MAGAPTAAPPARVRRGSVVPTGQERTFSTAELIVSKTDLKGVITYANDVFERVSCYSLGELVGQPHSIVRHPDMPRAVFQLLWDTIGAGGDLWAYINNLAADGANYWVLAQITPSFGPTGAMIGYHSNRRSPSREAIARITPLYARLLEVERRQPNGRSAVEAGTGLLTDLLAEQGQTYDEFVWSIIRDLEI